MSLRRTAMPARLMMSVPLTDRLEHLFGLFVRDLSSESPQTTVRDSVAIGRPPAPRKTLEGVRLKTEISVIGRDGSQPGGRRDSRHRAPADSCRRTHSHKLDSYTHSHKLDSRTHSRHSRK